MEQEDGETTECSRCSRQSSSPHSVSLAGFEPYAMNSPIFHTDCSEAERKPAAFVKKSKNHKDQPSRWSAAVCPQVFLPFFKTFNTVSTTTSSLQTFFFLFTGFLHSILSCQGFNFLSAVVTKR